MPPYEALSYCWGSELNRAFMNITHGSESSRLAIPSNLAAGLQRIRGHSESRLLWADSICINQADDSGKSVQIPFMSDIYGLADQVVIWPGEPVDDDLPLQVGSFLESMKAICSVMYPQESFPRAKQPASPAVCRTPPSQDILVDQHDPDFLPSTQFRALLNFLRNPWFHRAWTWQEASLAIERTIVHGRHSFDQNNFTALALTMITLQRRMTYDRDDSDYQTIIDAISPLVRDEEDDSKDNTLRRLLPQRRGVGCSLPQDLIYSLLGAAKQCPTISIDYRERVEIVYARTAYQLMVQEGSLTLLRYSPGHGRSSDYFPSWTPDWRDNSRYSISEDVQYNAKGSTQARVSLSEDCKVLSVAGILWDTIVATYAADLEDPERWLGSFMQLEGAYLDSSESCY